MFYKRNTLLIFALIFCLCPLIYADDRVIPGYKTPDAPKIDGILDDSCWQTAPVVSDFFFLPDGSRAAEPTKAMVCYDDTGLYVAFECKDSMPDKIVTQQKKRGGSLSSDDWVGFELACFTSKHPIVWFDVSAAGIQAESLQSGDVSKFEWRGDWTAAAQRTADGYNVEMLVPFSILQYDPSSKSMSVAFLRQHARGAHTWWSPNMGPIGSGEPKNFYTLQGLDLPRPKLKPLMMAYALAGVGEGDSVIRAGLDVKHAITPTVTAAVTMKPDFRNVEQAVDSIDFSYTDIYRSDSRPFFQEGKSYFPGSDIFYTRPIENIDLGAKAYGTYGDYRLGMLDARDFDGHRTSAFQVSREWSDQGHLHISGVQSNENGGTSSVGQMEGMYYLYNRRDQKVELNVSATNYDPFAAGSSSAYDIDIAAYGKPRVLKWTISRNHIDPGFNPGYVPENDRDLWHVSLGLGDNLSSGPINHWNIEANASRADHSSDSSFFYRNASLYAHVHWQNQIGAYLDLVSNDRKVDGYVQRFEDRYSRLRVKFASRDLYKQSEIEFASGKRGGGAYRFYRAETGWPITNKLSVRAGYQVRTIKSPSPFAYSTHQLVAGLTYDIDTERTLASRLVSEEGHVNLYMSYKRRVNNGMDVYVIFGDPNADVTKNSVLVKVLSTL